MVQQTVRHAPAGVLAVLRELVGALQERYEMSLHAL